jgi:hypothetical protein
MILPLTADERPILDEVGRLDLGGKTYWISSKLSPIA